MLAALRAINAAAAVCAAAPLRGAVTAAVGTVVDVIVVVFVQDVFVEVEEARDEDCSLVLKIALLLGHENVPNTRQHIPHQNQKQTNKGNRQTETKETSTQTNKQTNN